MKPIRLLLVPLLLVSFAAFAQEAPALAPAAEAAPVAAHEAGHVAVSPASPLVTGEPATTTSDPSPGELINGVVKVAADYKAGGALAAVAAILALLTQLTKLSIFRKILDDRGFGWVRPLIPLVVAGLGGLVVALQSGSPPGAALLAGIMAGVTGVGVHEVVRLGSSTERAKVRVDADTITAAADHMQAKMENDAAEKGDIAVASIKKKISDLADMPTHKRLQGLADLLTLSSSYAPGAKDVSKGATK